MNNLLPRLSMVRWAAPLITLFSAIIGGALYGVQLVVLILAAAALLLVIWLLWSSVQALTGESERTFGKISDDDYHEYAARYRAEAKRLIQGLEENLAEGRKQVEAELTRRLSKKLSTAKDGFSPETTSNGEAEPESRESAPASAPSEPKQTVDCPSCQAKNELDARFCKACGKSMAAAEESQS